MGDISVFVHGFKFNLRVGGIIGHGDEILLCRMKSRDWWFLPGGRIKANESSLAALERELTEEIGEGFRVVKPVLCAENFFEVEGTPFHEVCFFYEVRWLKEKITKHLEKDDEVFEWVPRSGIAAFNLKPVIIKDYIAAGRDSIELVIHRDRA